MEIGGCKQLLWMPMSSVNLSSKPKSPWLKMSYSHLPKHWRVLSYCHSWSLLGAGNGWWLALFYMLMQTIVAKLYIFAQHVAFGMFKSHRSYLQGGCLSQNLNGFFTAKLDSDLIAWESLCSMVRTCPKGHCYLQSWSTVVTWEINVKNWELG